METKPVLPLSKEHGSQVKDQGRWQCRHKENKSFPYRPTRDVSLLSGHASYNGTGSILLNALAEKRRDNYFISL